MAPNSKYEGIVIIGTPRSGTTLLRRMINAHPNIACPGETNLFSACARFLHSESIAENVDIGVLSGLGYAGFSEDNILQNLREFAFDFHREYARKQGKPRWAEKTAFDSFYLDAIERLCGDQSYFLCVQRHGLDVACSLQELCDKNGGYLSELHQYIKRYPRPLEAFSHVWVDLTEAIHHFVKRHPKNALLIRYEDLTAEPLATMQSIAEFIGEDWAPQWLDTALQKRDNLGLGDWKTYSKSQVDTASVGRWQHLSKATISMLGKICNPTLKTCGYPLVDIIDEHSSEEARRRYELGLMINAMRTSS